MLALAPLVAAAQDPSPPIGDLLSESAEPTTRVAVLPFRVHSPRPVEYLGRSLADLLRSRLEATGQLLVLDAATSENAAGSGAPPRTTARELSADYLVTGSLTELAGRFSLDVRITAAASGRRATNSRNENENPDAPSRRRASP